MPPCAEVRSGFSRPKFPFADDVTHTVLYTDLKSMIGCYKRWFKTRQRARFWIQSVTKPPMCCCSVVIELFTSVSPASWRAACMGQAWVSSQCALLCWYFFAPDDFIFMLWVKKSTYPLKDQLILMEACIRTLKQSHLMFRSPQQNRMLEDLHVLPLFRF